jgi:hypothetical protein
MTGDEKKAEALEWVIRTFTNEAAGNIRATLCFAGFSQDEADEAVDAAAEYMGDWRERSNLAAAECMREQDMWRQVDEALANRDA